MIDYIYIYIYIYMNANILAAHLMKAERASPGPSKSSYSREVILSMYTYTVYILYILVVMYTKTD